MEYILVYYGLFCITTAIAALFELMLPVMRELALKEPEHQLLELPFIAYAVFFGIAILTAPLTFFPCIVPSMGVHFRKTMLAGFLGDVKN